MKNKQKKQTIMSLHLILGPMFSGKSTRLLQHYQTWSQLVDVRVCMIKPNMDTRYTSDAVVCTHNHHTQPCQLIPVDGLRTFTTDAKVVLIEEGQFFVGLYDFVFHAITVDRKRVYVSALNGDAYRRPFGDIPQLLPLCSEVEYLHALCSYCRDATPGIYSLRVVNATAEETIVVGGAETYAAVCLHHYEQQHHS